MTLGKSILRPTLIALTDSDTNLMVSSKKAVPPRWQYQLIRYAEEYALLVAEINSDGSAGDTLDITNSDRAHGSQGIELKITHLRELGEVSGEIDAGIRFHHDYVERDHSVRGYAMNDGGTVFQKKSLRFVIAKGLPHILHIETVSRAAKCRL